MEKILPSKDQYYQKRSFFLIELFFLEFSFNLPQQQALNNSNYILKPSQEFVAMLLICIGLLDLPLVTKIFMLTTFQNSYFTSKSSLLSK